MINSRPVFQILLALVVLPSCNVHSQSTSRLFTFQNFEKKILTYEPVQQVDVTDKKFQKGKFYLSETRSATENDPKNLNGALKNHFHIPQLYGHRCFKVKKIATGGINSGYFT